MVTHSDIKFIGEATKALATVMAVFCLEMPDFGTCHARITGM